MNGGQSADIKNTLPSLRWENLVKALILAGGLGKRLRPLTSDRPKPLVPVAGKPIMVWQFEWLRKHGINEVVLAVGYLKERVMDEIGSGRKFNIRVSYVVEDEPLGTAGAVKNAESVLKREEYFVVLNGDVITNIELTRMFECIKDSTDLIGAIAVVPLPSPYGIIHFDEKTGYIKKFMEKPVLKEYWINAGVYVFTPRIFDYLPEKGDIERTVFPKLAERKQLKAVAFEGAFWKSIDTHKDIEEAEKLLARNFNAQNIFK